MLLSRGIRQLGDAVEPRPRRAAPGRRVPRRRGVPRDPDGPELDALDADGIAHQLRSMPPRRLPAIRSAGLRSSLGERSGSGWLAGWALAPQRRGHDTTRDHLESGRRLCLCNADMSYRCKNSARCHHTRAQPRDTGRDGMRAGGQSSCLTDRCCKMGRPRAVRTSTGRQA